MKDRVYHVGYIVPIVTKDGKRRYCLEITPNDYSEFEDMLRKLREYLERYTTKLREESKDKSVCKTVLLKAVGDFIVAFFHLPLVLPLYPRYTSKELTSNAYITPQELYWLWVLTRHSSKYHELLWDVNGGESEEERGLPNILEAIFRNYKTLIDYAGLDVLTDSSYLSRVHGLLMKIPADTRPGLNTSKLVVHLLATSALAVCKFKSRSKGVNVSEYHLQILRLASLLHDIGKPRQWFSSDPAKTYHTITSSDIAKELLEDIIDDDDLLRIRLLIEYHHNPNGILSDGRVSGEERDILHKLCGILGEADRDASAIDRVRELVLPIIAKELNVPEGELKKRFDSWDFWLSINNEKIKKASERAAQHLHRGSLPPGGGRRVSDVALVLCDIRGIQGYIGVESLRDLAARSYLIDLTVMYVIPRVFQEELGLPPECIVYAGGGFTTILVYEFDDPKGVFNGMKAKFSSIMDGIGPSWEGIVKTYSELYDDWRYTWTIASSRHITNKNTREYKETPIILSIVNSICKPCDVCRSKPASIMDEYGRFLCDECEKIEKGISKELYFTSKINRLNIVIEEDKKGEPELDVEKLPSWRDNLRSWILEWLAGQDCPRERRMLNISIVKVDGNFMGAFMSDAISLNDVFERSIRVDYALKKGIHMLLDFLKNYHKTTSGRKERNIAIGLYEHGFKRVYMGLLYAGGDDALLILPSWLSLPAALYIAYWFWRELGRTRQLSISIASGKVKHNIWALVDSATEILDEYCKKKFREELTGKSVNDVLNVLENTVAVVGFIFSEQSNVTPALVNSILEHNLSKQPYVLSFELTPRVELMDISSFMGLVLGVNTKYNTLDELEQYLRKAIVEAYEAFKEAKNNGTPLAIRVRNELYRLYGASHKYLRLGDEAFKASLTSFIARELARREAGDEVRKVYERFVKYFIKPHLGEVIPLFDVYMFSKLVMGGAK